MIVRGFFAVFAVVAAALAGGPASAQQGGWNAAILPTEQPVTMLRQVGSEVYVQAGQWFRVGDCAGTVCLERGRPAGEASPRDGIPGGGIAAESGNGAVEAWYGQPTTRYDHGILGDQVEGGSLVVVDAAGRRHEIVLGHDQVFEDLTPRIADIDGDGSNDVVTIRSGLATGGAIAVYGFRDGTLVELAAIPPIGRTHRWLNIAGIVDFNGDGRLDIALVKTPHIGGTLEFWTMRNGSLQRLAAAGGFSNHAIGSTELGMAAIADFDGDGVADLALPNADRTALRIVRLANSTISEIAVIPLGLPVATAVGVACSDICSQLLLGRVDGSLVVIRSGAGL